ncbi:MgtC/SapB family protein, partial [Escherichia coli]|nr:MgtC/SapB family protein [Escherichia coli]
DLFNKALTLVNGNTVSMLDWFKQQKIKTDLVSLQENEDHEVVAIDIQLHATTSIEDLLRLLKGMAGVKGVSIS